MECNKYFRKSDQNESDGKILAWINTIKYFFTSINTMRSKLFHPRTTSSIKKMISRAIILGLMIVLPSTTLTILDKYESNNELNSRQLLKSSKIKITNELNETLLNSTYNVSNTSEELLFNFDNNFFRNDFIMLNNSTNDEESDIEMSEKQEYSKIEATYRPKSIILSKAETYRPEISTNEDSNMLHEEEYSKAIEANRPESILSTILPLTFNVELRPSELELEAKHNKETKITKEPKKKKELDYVVSSPFNNNNIVPLQELKEVLKDITSPTNPVEQYASAEVISIALPRQYPQTAKTYSGQLTFYVMGDIPYNKKEDLILKNQLRKLPDDASFLVHVGDIQTPRTSKCRESHFEKVRDILLHNSNVPTFIIPGDNDWKDCPNPDKALNIWMKNFEKFDEHWSPLPFNVKYQRLLSDRDDKYCPSQNRPENFSFIYKNVLFISVHVIGEESNKYNTERIKRHKDNAIWLKKNIRRSCRDGINSVVVFTHKGYKNERMYSDVFNPLQELYDEMHQKYLKRLPIIVIHGNGHKYEVSNPFQRKDMLDLQVDQGRINEPLKVTIDLDYFPYEPKKNKNLIKGYDKKNGIQYFNMFEFDRRF